MSFIDGWTLELMRQAENQKTNNYKKYNKCIKKANGYHLYLRCTCGCELNADIYYWSDFKLCPSCGAKVIEE